MRFFSDYALRTIILGMPKQRKRRRWGYALAVALMVPALSAVVMEQREYHGKMVTCAHSGLLGVARVCGTRGYARVFTGTVESVIEVGDTDKRLELMPNEVFLGDSGEVTAITNQACLHTEIQPGEQWLFYLYREPQTDTLVVPYDSPSKPTLRADDDIAMLRHLVRLRDSGILVGKLATHEGNHDRLADVEVELTYLNSRPEIAGTPLQNHKVVAKNEATSTEYSTFTNANGHFEFELPPGKYRVIATAEQGFRGVETSNEISVGQRECLEYSFNFWRTPRQSGLSKPPK